MLHRIRSDRHHHKKKNCGHYLVTVPPNLSNQQFRHAWQHPTTARTQQKGPANEAEDLTADAYSTRIRALVLLYTESSVFCISCLSAPHPTSRHYAINQIPNIQTRSSKHPLKGQICYQIPLLKLHLLKSWNLEQHKSAKRKKITLIQSNKNHPNSGHKP